MTFIWEEETTFRKEYLANRFMEESGIDIDNSSFEDWKNAINNIDGVLKEYINAEASKEKMLKESYEIVKNENREKKLEKYIEKKYQFESVKGKSYRVSKKVLTGKIKGKDVKVRVEETLRKGKVNLRYRDDKGRFASIV